MQIDLSPLVQGSIALFASVAAVCGPVALAWLGRVLRLQAGSVHMTELRAAADAGAGIAYQLLTAAATGPCEVEIKNAAIGAGVQHVLRVAPQTLLALGINSISVRAMVIAALGRLLALDPTVPAGPSAVAPIKPASLRAN